VELYTPAREREFDEAEAELAQVLADSKKKPAARRRRG
jgi:hypothetical protein